jgi:cytochrome c oxidase subunit 3
MSHAHDPHLQHHFDTPEQQFDAGKLGIWLFLATEILLFGGLFAAYAIYRANHPEIFVYAHQFLDKRLGGTNTVILLCSSLTMAWAVRASQLGQRKLLITLLSLTLLGGFGFMGIKYVEYKQKWEHGLLPGTHFSPHEEGEHPPAKEKPASIAPASGAPAPEAHAVTKPETDRAASEGEKSMIKPAAAGPAGTVIEDENAAHGVGHGKRPSNTQIFFGIYFLMTGLHGLHVLIGMGAIGWILVRSLRGEFGPDYYTPVDFVGLYWHLVDLIWIFLFPLLYLIS